MSANLLSPKVNEDVVRWDEKKELERTFEITTASEKANYQVEQPPPTEMYRSFHIANIVPDLFKNHDDSMDKTTAVEVAKISTEIKREVEEMPHESVKQIEQLRERKDTQSIKQDSDSIHSFSEGINTTIKLESMEKTEVKDPIGALVLGFQEKDLLADKETVKPECLEFSNEEKPYTEMDDNFKFSDDRMPLLSPDKPLAVSLIELDHSYGLSVHEEQASTEEPELFDESNKEPPLPGDRELTESLVVDIVTVDSELTLLPEAEPKPQFPVRSFEADDELVYEFHRLGIDAEDCYYLKVGFEQLQQVASDSVVDAHWSSHPHILLISIFCYFRSQEQQQQTVKTSAKQIKCCMLYHCYLTKLY